MTPKIHFGVELRIQQLSEYNFWFMESIKM